MAWENGVLDISLPAAEDLSSDQYRFVVLTSSGTVRRPDSTTEAPLGVLQNAPGSGEAASVRVLGYSKLHANDALTVGTYVKGEYVSATDAGKGQDAAGEYQCARGRIVLAAGAEDDLATVELLGPTPTRQSVSIPLSALTANTTVYDAVLAVRRAMKITKVSVAAMTAPSDADGVCTLQLKNYDLSATADDDLTDALDLEGLTAKNSADLTLTATAADLVLEAGDMVYAALVNDSGAIDTNMADAVLTVEFDLL